MRSSPAAGPTVARRTVFEPGRRPCRTLVRPGDETGRLTTEEITEGLTTAMSWCHLPVVPPETTPALPVPSTRPQHACALRALGGDPAEHQPHAYRDAHPDHWHAFHQHVLATPRATGHATELGKTPEV